MGIFTFYIGSFLWSIFIIQNNETPAADRFDLKSATYNLLALSDADGGFAHQSPVQHSRAGVVAVFTL